MDAEREAAVRDAVERLMEHIPWPKHSSTEDREHVWEQWIETLAKSCPQPQEYAFGRRMLDRFLGENSFSTPGTRVDGHSTSPDALRPLKQYGAPSSFIRHGRLGEGATSIVWSCTDERSGHTYALKLLSKLDQVARESLAMGEAQSLIQLRHRNIVSVYGTGTVLLDGQETPYLAMEQLVSENFRTWHARSRPGMQPAVFVVALIADALAYCHNHGITHGDPSPDNIMVGKTGLTTDAVKLIDFGLSVKHYRPPALAAEPSRPARARLDAWNEACREDLRRLGGTLYFAVTGSDLPPLFHLPAERERLSPSLDRVADPVLRAILHKIFSNQAGEAYRSVAELARDLSRWLNWFPVTDLAISYRPWHRFQLLVERCRHQNRPDDHAAILGVIFLILGISIFFLGSHAVLQPPTAIAINRTLSWSSFTVVVLSLGLALGFWWITLPLPIPSAEPWGFLRSQWKRITSDFARRHIGRMAVYIFGYTAAYLCLRLFILTTDIRLAAPAQFVMIGLAFTYIGVSNEFCRSWLVLGAAIIVASFFHRFVTTQPEFLRWVPAFLFFPLCLSHALFLGDLLLHKPLQTSTDKLLADCELHLSRPASMPNATDL